MGIVLVEIPVDEATASTLADPAMRRSAGLLLRHMARPVAGPDPLAALLRAAYDDAPEPALTEDDIAAELAEWKKERAARPE